MAKAGFWLRGARGKLAGASIGKGSQGGTVIREIVSPSNPQTTAQMIQRIIWATISQAYSHLKEIADHSFEGFKAGSECQQEFMKRNVRALRTRVATAVQAGVETSEIYDFIPVGSTELAHNSLILSQGTLPVIMIGDDEADAISNYFNANANTYQGVADALGLQRGDQITLIQVANVNGSAQMRYARIILDPIDGGVEQPMSTQFVKNTGVINYPSPRNMGSFTRIAYDSSLGGVSFSLFTTDQPVLAAAAIASRYSNNDEWLRSNSNLNFKLSAGYLYSLEQALAMTQAGVQTLSDLYLNNAGSGNIAGSTDATSITTIAGVFVNGNPIANASTPTSIYIRDNNTVVINLLNAVSNSYVAYRINGGDWIAAQASNGSHAFTGLSFSENDSVEFAVGTSAAGFIVSSKYTGKASMTEVPQPMISQVRVGDTAISASGNTYVNSGTNVAVIFTTANVYEDMYVSYKIGSGAWATPALVSSNSANMTIPTLAENDTVQFAIGDGSTSSAFTPSRTYGGTAVVPVATISSVTLNGTTIANSGTTSVETGSNVPLVIRTVNAIGKYASYKIGSGAWATPVAIASNSTNLTIPSLADTNVVSFAIGTGATAEAFTATNTWGGTATASEPGFSNMKWGTYDWDRDLNWLSGDQAAEGTITGQYNGEYSHLILLENADQTGPFLPSYFIGTPVTKEQFNTSGLPFNFTPGGGKYYGIIAVNYNESQTTAYTQFEKYRYTNQADL